MSETNEQAFVRMLRSWEQGGIEQVCTMIRELFADDAIWIQPGLPTTTGPEEAVALAQTWGKAVPSYELEIRHVAGTGDAVLAERFETFRHGDGSVYLALPVVGVAEFRGGKIAVWREYYDTAIVPGLGS